jgi:hypothetical protein
MLCICVINGISFVTIFKYHVTWEILMKRVTRKNITDLSSEIL